MMEDFNIKSLEIDAAEIRMRSELTPTEYAEHMQRRKEIWEAPCLMSGRGENRLPPLAERKRMQIQVAQVEPPESCSSQPGYKYPPKQEKDFAASTAEATGKSKASTNRATRRAREVCQQARDLIRGTRLDTGAFLDSLIKQGLSDDGSPMWKEIEVV